MDWFGKKSWSKKDEEHFFIKLNRARKDNRAQYIKIQALTLIETNKPKLLDVAENLLNKVLVEYPENRIEKSPVLYSLGELYYKRNDLNKALEYYKLSIDFEEEFPNVITNSYIKYSLLVIQLELKEHYNYVLTLLEPKLEESIFPLEKYEIASVLSDIYSYKNNENMAIKYANIAEDNANQETSGLVYHKYLGIVKNRIGWLDKLTKRK